MSELSSTSTRESKTNRPKMREGGVPGIVRPSSVFSIVFQCFWIGALEFSAFWSR